MQDPQKFDTHSISDQSETTDIRITECPKIEVTCADASTLCPIDEDDFFKDIYIFVTVQGNSNRAIPTIITPALELIGKTAEDVIRRGGLSQFLTIGATYEMYDVEIDKSEFAYKPGQRLQPVGSLFSHKHLIVTPPKSEVQEIKDESFADFTGPDPMGPVPRVPHVAKVHSHACDPLASGAVPNG